MGIISPSPWRCRIRTEKMLWLEVKKERKVTAYLLWPGGGLMFPGTHWKKGWLITHQPAAGVLVQVGAGKALVFTTHFQEFPGLLSILNMNPIEIWEAKERRAYIRGKHLTLFLVSPKVPSRVHASLPAFPYLSRRDCHSDPHTAAASASCAAGYVVLTGHKAVHCRSQRRRSRWRSEHLQGHLLGQCLAVPIGDSFLGKKPMYRASTQE